MICSVKNESILPEMEDFGQWMVSMLSSYGAKIHLIHGFKQKASFNFHCTPGATEEVTQCYSKINHDFPEVLYLIHILPEPNSAEFYLMKTLSTKYALIGQGVQLASALSKFSHCNGELEVMNNMNQWILRRLAELVSRHKTEYFRLTVNGHNPLPPMKCNDNFDSTVEAVLHSVILVRDPEALEKIVLVSGFPVNFNKFQIASLFSNFRPTNVLRAAGDEAIVEFTNKFHAAQAIFHYNQLSFDDEGFVLTVVAAYRDPISRQEEIRCKLASVKLNNETAAD